MVNRNLMRQFDVDIDATPDIDTDFESAIADWIGQADKDYEANKIVTGNVVENASTAGFVVGWGRYLRDVALTGNVVRNSDIGVAVSVVPGAGTALIANNVISGTPRGAIVGMDHHTPVTGDLAKEGAGKYAHLSLSGNRVS